MQNTDILDDFTFDDQPEWAGDGEVVAKYYSVLEAELAAARLRSEGIHCFLANAISQSVVPHLQGFVRLHTRPKDADRAREILQDAAVDAEDPLPRKSSGATALIFMAILIGLTLAWLLVQSIG
jgi:hypothetical protein